MRRRIPTDPRNARWQLLLAAVVLSIGLIGMGCDDDDNPSKPGGELTDTLSIEPSSAIVAAGGQQQFTARATGEDDVSAQWSVLGTGDVGQISTDGLYTAPATVSDEVTITIQATAPAVYDNTAFAEVTVTP